MNKIFLGAVFLTTIFCLQAERQIAVQNNSTDDLYVTLVTVLGKKSSELRIEKNKSGSIELPGIFLQNIEVRKTDSITQILAHADFRDTLLFPLTIVNSGLSGSVIVTKSYDHYYWTYAP